MSRVIDLLDMNLQQSHSLEVEDLFFLVEYLKDVIVDLKDIHNLDEKEAFLLLKNSAFVKTLNRDPEYVVNHDTEYWAEKLYNRRYYIWIKLDGEREYLILQ